MTFSSKLFSTLTSGKLWTTIGGVVGIIGLLVSSFQFYEAAALNNRTFKGQLALEAHEKAYEFIAEFTQNYKPETDKAEIIRLIESPNGPVVPPEIRTALIRSDGAISRALIIENEDVRACLQQIYTIQATLIESTMRMSKDVSLQEYALDLDDFPAMVGLYIEGKDLKEHHIGTSSANEGRSCSIIRSIEEFGF